MPDIYTDTTSMTVSTVDSYSYTKQNMYFLNSEFLDFVVAKGQDLTIGPFIQPKTGSWAVKTSLIKLEALQSMNIISLN